jgi:hypothetical protein
MTPAPEVIFTQAHAETLATLDAKLTDISQDIKELKTSMESCYHDVECRVAEIERRGSTPMGIRMDAVEKLTVDLNGRMRDAEVHGTTHAQKLDIVLSDLCKDHDKLKAEFHYSQGRLAMVFIFIGAGVSAIISYLVNVLGGN